MDVERWKSIERLSLVAWLPESYRKALHVAENEVLSLVETWIGTIQVDRLSLLITPFSGLYVPAVGNQSACSSPPATYWASQAQGRSTLDKSDTAHAFKQWAQAVERLSVPDELPFFRHYAALLGLAQTHLRNVAAHASDVPQTLQRQLISAHAAALWMAREQGESDAGFALLVADLSGIQNYLFGTAAFGVGGVARSLRARSFYLTQIAALFAWNLLDRLGLPPANLLLDSGGKFYLLFAPTQTALVEVESVKREAAQKWGLEMMHGELSLNVAYTRYTSEDLRGGAFGTIWQNASRAVAREKQQRLGSALHDAGGWRTESFLLPGAFDHHEPCHACKRFPQLSNELRCAACKRDEDLGKRLPSAAWIAYERGNATKPEDIAAFGWRVRIGMADMPPSDSAEWVLALDSRVSHEAAPLPVRSLARHVPLDPKTRQPLTFAEIAAKAQGRPCLAYLKADVDRLGERFVFGLRDSQGVARDSMPRLIYLSRALETFFGGELEQIVRQDFSDCYIVFSGGDDLTIIGPYDQILRLSSRLARDFHHFLGYPEGVPQPIDVLTISAGIALVSPRVPVSTAIPRAELALEAAKDGGRNAICLLGRTLTWAAYDRMLSRLWDDQGKPAPGLGQEMMQGVSSSFLYHLLKYASMWEDYQAGKREGLRYQPLLAYDIGRNVDPRKTPTAYDWATWLAQIPLDDGGNWQAAMDDLGLFTRMAMLYRGGGERIGRTA